MTALWLIPVGTPLLIALLLLLPGGGRRIGSRIAPWAAAPAFVLALVPDPGPPITVPWLFLGTTIGLDVTGHVFLFLVSTLWLAAGVYARRYVAEDPQRARFFAFFALTMAGNLGITLAGDIGSFYLSFALMTFAAYPLIVHAGHAEAMRAGRIYLIMAVVGEAMLLVAFLLIASAGSSLTLASVPATVAVSPWRDLIIALLLGGFGIKAGALPLHVWLPLAHPVAPTPASAVLSGALIKAGLLGWLRFLPLGEIDLDGWGSLLIVVGVVSAFFGVAIGVTQRDPKIALAYSSISQMGIINIAIGAGLAEPVAWPAAQVAALVYVLHHGLAKASLFLGVGVAVETPTAGLRRRLVLGAMALAGLALAGAPLTSGALAKLSLKDAAALAPVPWAGWLDLLLPLAAVGTTLLMARVLHILPFGREDRDEGPPRGLVVPWAALVGGVVVVAFLVPPYRGVEVVVDLLLPASLWTNAWPVAVALALAWAARRWSASSGRRIDPVVAGDMLVPLERAWGRRDVDDVVELVDRTPDVPGTGPRAALTARAARVGDLLEAGETRLMGWGMAVGLFVALALGLLVAVGVT
jgi:formate hydrogenlyase subunit 3/multisubunit Na+/H+ antiporter MnhD subunit